MKKLVTLWKRPSYDGRSFTYYMLYTDEHEKRRQKSLGHADARKAERQRAQLERELRMGVVEQASMKLSQFLEDCVGRTQGQVRENTVLEYESTMRQFIKVIGDIDFRRIEHKHGEQFLQACLDSGNRPATVAKKVGTMKRLFELAVQRRQLEENPLRFLRKPKSTARPIKVFTDEECTSMIIVAYKTQIGIPFRWDILLLTALCTGMRRGELLNTTWKDIDFASERISISPKSDTDYTWQWQIKNTNRRIVPLTSEVVSLLAAHQADQPDGYPYVFVPPTRYDYIQRLRRQGKLGIRKKLCPMNNFRRQFRLILRYAGIEEGQFHDLRRTCITNWFADGLSEFEVMTMAGHSSFETTRRFYLAIRKDLLDRARKASAKAMSRISVANLLQQPFSDKKKKGCQTQPFNSQRLKH